MIFDNFTIADSKQAGMEFYKTNFTKQLVIAQNSAIIGITQYNNFPILLNSSKGIIAPRTSNWKMSNIRFHNFAANQTTFQTCSKCDNIKLYSNTAQEYLVQNISYSNVNGSYLYMGVQKREIIHDLDGSFSGFGLGVGLPGTVVWGFRHLLDQPACSNATVPARWDNALYCNSSLTLRRIMFTNL